MTASNEPARSPTRRKAVPPPTKAALVRSLLSLPRGATQTELIDATSWQPRSVRAFLSGLRKRGHVLTRALRKDGQSAYQLFGDAGIRA